MRRLPLLVPTVVLLAACAKPGGIYPSLAPRTAEAIDPRIPLPTEPSPGTLDPALAARLAAAVAQARGGVGEYDRLASLAERAAAAVSGAGRSESWIAAQQALSALEAQHGVTTRAAGDVDMIAATRIESARWLVPADRTAIEAAAAEIGAIRNSQAERIRRLRERLDR